MRGLLLSFDEEGVYEVRGVERPTDASNRGTHDTLHWMYDLLGCSTVDVVRLDDAIDMWLDDEGMYSSEVNQLATAIAQEYGFVHQPYYGAVLFLGGADRAGNTRGLTEATERKLLEQIQAVTA